ncbi:MAG TPA: prephenate dehydratase domain-containing protein, partial [Vicinamibacterales bacterium]|nr:prephenate dehydratase domain-containing protein [Vicinamibacterales bacterium]
MTNQDLASLRRSLDDIDSVLVSALGERARLAREIAHVKADGEGPVRDADRETALLQHRSAVGERLGLDPAFVRRIFREILDDSVRRQQDALQSRSANAAQEIVVGFQGTEGAYGHQAALQHFAVAQRAVNLKAYSTFKEMLEAVLEGHVDRAVLPIENTTAGSVYEAYDLLLRFNLSLVGEEIVDVRHCLLGVGGTPVESLRRIHSHPQALSQCSEFLSTLKTCEGVSAANTALAARHVKQLNDPTEA